MTHTAAAGWAEALAPLLDNMPQLRSLYIRACFAVPGGLPEPIARKRGLTSLVLTGNNLESLPDALPFLQGEWRRALRHRPAFNIRTAMQ